MGEDPDAAKASLEQSTNEDTPAQSYTTDPALRRARIAELNDQLRRFGTGGVVTISAGLAALPIRALNRIFGAVATFDAFTANNDPHGEHDCAVLDVGGLRILWKIDYFDQSLEHHSPDAANPDVTRRVLTIMRADEY